MFKMFCKTPANCDSAKIPYFITSHSLKNIFLILNQQPEESMLYMAGIKVEENRIIELPIQPKFSVQTVFSVKPDERSALEALLFIDKCGMALYATIHLHPRKGILATRPSSEDIRNQLAWEFGGYKNLMGIFSRDGFIRFLRFTSDFVIKVIGKEVTDVKDGCCNSRIFHLLETEKIQGEGDQERRIGFCYGSTRGNQGI